jgi:hypothetical protein
MIGSTNLATDAVGDEQRFGLQRIQVMADGYRRDIGGFGKLIYRGLVA